MPNNAVSAKNCWMDAQEFKWRNLGIIVNRQGYLIHPDIKQHVMSSVERGAMSAVHGIVVHQTNGSTPESAFSAYQQRGVGAHFLIDRDGTVYQTASVYKVAYHVGAIRARCLAEHRCTPAQKSALNKMKPFEMHKNEMKKVFPDRYPSNNDSIGIELVGEALPRGNDVPDDKKVYETVSEKQNASLKRLIQIIKDCSGVSMNEIYRHPVLSRKNTTEALTAKW